MNSVAEDLLIKEELNHGIVIETRLKVDSLFIPLLFSVLRLDIHATILLRHARVCKFTYCAVPFQFRSISRQSARLKIDPSPNHADRTQVLVLYCIHFPLFNAIVASKILMSTSFLSTDNVLEPESA